MFWNKSKFKFSRKSIKELETCHPDLQRLFKEVIKQFDCSVIGGHRSNEQQNEFFKKGYTKLKGGQSKHNLKPSRAVDVCPYHEKKPNIDWECLGNFYVFAGYVLGVADQMDIKIRWGGSWNGSYDVRINKFNDLPHFQLED